MRPFNRAKRAKQLITARAIKAEKAKARAAVAERAASGYDPSGQGSGLPGHREAEISGILKGVEGEGWDDEEGVADVEEERVPAAKPQPPTLQAMMESAKKSREAFDRMFPSRRGPNPSTRTLQRKVVLQKQHGAAKNTPTIDSFLKPLQTTAPTTKSTAKATTKPPLVAPPPDEPHDDVRREEQLIAAKELKKMLSKKHGLNRQSVDRHEAVLEFLNIQISRRPGETRKELAEFVARAHGKGSYFARRISIWEREWLADRRISEGKRGCFTKRGSALSKFKDKDEEGELEDMEIESDYDD